MLKQRPHIIKPPTNPLSNPTTGDEPKNMPNGFGFLPYARAEYGASVSDAAGHEAKGPR